MLSFSFRFFVGFFVLWATPIFAYPTFYAKSYRSCVVCHASSEGGGVLTSYGQGIANSEAALGGLGSSEKPWELRLFNEQLKVYAQARTIGVYNLNSRRFAYFPMQADLGLFQSIGENFRLNAMAGYDSQAKRVNEVEGLPFVLRKLTLGSRGESYEISLGRDYLPASIATDDHTSYMRTQTRMGVNDFVSVAKYAGWTDSTDYSFFIAGPGFQESAQNREYGFGARFETEYFKNSSFASTGGFYFYNGYSDAMSRFVLTPFGRLRIAKGLGLQYEYTRLFRNPAQAESFGQNIFALKPYVFLSRGLVFSLPIEYYTVEEPESERAFQLLSRFDYRLFGNASIIGMFSMAKFNDISFQKKLSLQFFLNF
jgi:hypothetical protein